LDLVAIVDKTIRKSLVQMDRSRILDGRSLHGKFCSMLCLHIRY